MKIDKYIEIVKRLGDIIKGTKYEGHVFTVGGCERDYQLCQDIKDIDLVVDLPNGGITLATWLSENGFTIGKYVCYEHYGTAMFRLKDFPDEELEAVQTRCESYRDINTRNPETAYGTIQQDCMRRDFTMNALYRNVTTNQLIDFTGSGLNDIKARVIRSCDNPDIIFKEDPLRILRALRFQAKLGWVIEDDTYDGMVRNVDRLEIISRERITDEFNKMLSYKSPKNALNKARRIGALKYISKVLADAEIDKWDSAVDSLTYSLDTISERIPILFYWADREKLESELRAMKYPNDFIKDCKFIIDEIDTVIEIGNQFPKMDIMAIKKLQYRSPSQKLFQQLVFTTNAIVNRAVPYGIKRDNRVMHVLGHTLSMVLRGEDCFKRNIPVDGIDVMDMKGIGPGPKVSEYLSALREEWFKNPKIERHELLGVLSKLNL